ncbi:hypothetical protein [Sphingobacterium anhuiense]|uniref:Type I phosphodiesterase / nucleotide pyrophosphatase n=1 Tax=Sphingobacterium anhuiense TaxID=493780 RepID=A0ABW5Z482_9SPHI
MKREIKSKIGMKMLGVAAFIATILVSSSCNKDFVNKLPDSFKNDTLGVSDGSRRVLYLILDGVKGSVVESLGPKNISLITKRSMYSYDGLADFQRNNLTDAGAWTTMLTGVDYTKHQVQADDFSGFDNQKTPTIFSRLKVEKNNLRTVSFASATGLNNALAKDATEKKDLTNDAAVKDAVISELSTQDPSLLVAQFKGAKEAAGSDYSENNAAYTAAIGKLDDYIGEIMTALQARKTYNGENWLVIIASNKGGGVSGGEPGSNIYDDESRNTFVSFYNPKFTAANYAKPNVEALPYAGVGPRFASNNGSTNGLANLNSNTSIGNFGVSGAYTLMFKIRNDDDGDYYPMFVGKRNPGSTDVGPAGWSFLMGGGEFQVDWTGSPRPGGGINHADGVWHTMGFTIYHSGNSRRLNLFSDGVLRSTSDITNRNADNNFPLRIGTDARFNTNILVKDLVILNTALSDDEMIKYMRKEFGSDNPYFENAIGFWPGNESSGNKMYDHSGKGNHFDFSSTIQFANFMDISPNISPNISQSAFVAVPNNVDIPVMIYNWMNISVPKTWGLMGKFYNPTINLPKD